jgi:hypothetical protein
MFDGSIVFRRSASQSRSRKGAGLELKLAPPRSPTCSARKLRWAKKGYFGQLKCLHLVVFECLIFYINSSALEVMCTGLSFSV